MRALPCRVIPLPGETPTGFLARLAAANAIDAMALANYILREAGTRSIGPTNHLLMSAAESAGALPPGHFAHDRARFRMYRRCHHVGWKLRRCARCDVVDEARSACSVCSEGIATEVFGRGGGYCIRHRRWHFRGEDKLVGSPEGYRRAEQTLSGLLWSRGVSMHTGELDLATRLILDSWQEPPEAERRTVTCVYGPAVDLLVTLTDADVVLGLTALAERDTRQIEGLIGLVVGAGGGSRTPELETTAAAVVKVHRAAMYTAIQMPRSSGSTISKAPFEKGIAEAAYREKAVLLRHVTRSGRRVDVVERAVQAAPVARVVSQRIVPGWADNVPWMKRAAGKRSAIPKIGGVVGDQVDQSDTKHLSESEQGPQRRVGGMARA